MSKLTYHQRCFGWASGHYLADEVDKTFWELDDDEQLEFAYNNFEADSIEEYIDCVKTQFSEEYNIELSDSEITEIEEIQ